MDTPGAISYLAAAEARNVWALRDDEAAVAGLPYVRVRREGGGRGAPRYAVAGHGHAGHDNAPRMEFLCDWLSRRVLPLVDPACDVSGCYRWELHDAISYLPRRREPGRYYNALTFGRADDDRETRVALAPDCYHIMGFGGATEVRDPIPLAAKASQLFFAGTTTGDRDPRRNVRIQACLWARRRAPDVARFTITSIAQMDPAAALAAVPELRACLGPHVPLPEHHRYRYQVNLVGNTACWSRVPMVMASNSLLLHVRHPDMLWYYPLLREGTHYLGAEALGELLPLRQRCDADLARCQGIVADAQRFVADHLRPRHADAYMAQLMEASVLYQRR